jgi:hypothetical protein
MPRYIPPHLMALVVLLIVVLWFMLVHHFRRSVTMQKFIAEALGDNTPENALVAFEAARLRLREHLAAGNLEGHMRRRIEVALGLPQADEAIESYVEPRAL